MMIRERSLRDCNNSTLSMNALKDVESRFLESVDSFFMIELDGSDILTMQN